MNDTIQCPHRDRLAALLSGNLTAEQEEGISQHLEHCRRCRVILEQIADGRGLFERLSGWTRDWSDYEAQETRAHNIGEDLTVSPDRDAGASPHKRIKFGFLNPSDQPGSLGKLGHYEVLELIGKGGMGLVFRVYDSKLQRDIAVKVLNPKMAKSKTARRRFTREAHRAAEVSHPNVIRVLDVAEHTPPSGYEGPLPMILMELVPGRTLTSIIEEDGVLSVKETIHAAYEIAAGLEIAHETNVIHRDIKPSNILIEAETQRVVITDFGLARAVDDVGLTQTGVVAGTPAFMSPEQAVGHHLDHRTDLFSLGCVMYAALTGESPFDAKNPIDMIDRVRDEDPRPIEQIRKDIPLKLRQLIYDLLSKDPLDRPTSTREVQARLEAIRHNTVRARVESFLNTNPRGKIIVAVAGAMLILAVGWWGFGRTTPEEPVIPVSLSEDDDSSQIESDIVPLPDLRLTAAVVSEGRPIEKFKDLQSAIDWAPTGSTIELQIKQSGTLNSLKIADKTLLIRGTGETGQLLITATKNSNTIDIDNADLIIENLDVSWAGVGADVLDVPDRLFDVSKSRLTLRNCRLKNTGPGCLLQAQSCPLLRIERSNLIAPDGVAVRILPTESHTVEISESVFLALRTLESQIIPSEGTVQFDLQKSLFAGRVFWQMQPMSDADFKSPRASNAAIEKGRIQVAITSCIFDIDEAILNLIVPRSFGGTTQEQTLKLSNSVYFSVLSGTWNQSLYSQKSRFLEIFASTATPSRQPSLNRMRMPGWAPRSLADWQQRWNTDLDSSLRSDLSYGRREGNGFQPADRTWLQTPREIRVSEPDIASERFGPDFEQIGPTTQQSQFIPL